VPANTLISTTKQSLIQMFNDLIVLFAVDLERAYPQASPAQCQAVGYAIVCLAMSNESFLWLGMSATYNAAARTGAEALLRTLEQTTPSNIA